MSQDTQDNSTNADISDGNIDANRNTIGDTNEKQEDAGLFPIRPKWFKIGFYTFLLVWTLYILREALTYDDFEDYFFPYMLSVPILLLILIKLVTVQYPVILDWVMPSREVADSQAQETVQRQIEGATESAASKRPKAKQEEYELIMLFWVMVLPFMMYFLGMGLTLPLYIFGFTWFFVRNLKTAVGITLLVNAFVYVLFIRILDMIVWTGVWGLPDPFEFIPF